MEIITGVFTKMDLMLKESIKYTLDYSEKLIISPDMDGFISAQLINRYNGAKVVGTYDKNILCLADDIDPEDCLFVDCDMNRERYVSIGNHMRLVKDNMSTRGFNPNSFFGINKYSAKFPFATAYLISFATEIETSATEIIRMAYADSTLRNMELYSDNMRIWSDRMKCPAVDYVISATDYAKQLDDELRVTYTTQSFTSKRYGKKRYIEEVNAALIKENVPHETIKMGKKYMSDKVGLNTVMRYNGDIISYAEVYGGEYSVTYDQEIAWT